jgi:hypothetical protein
VSQVVELFRSAARAYVEMVKERAAPDERLRSMGRAWLEVLPTGLRPAVGEDPGTAEAVGRWSCLPGDDLAVFAGEMDLGLRRVAAGPVVLQVAVGDLLRTITEWDLTREEWAELGSADEVTSRSTSEGAAVLPRVPGTARSDSGSADDPWALTARCSPRVMASWEPIAAEAPGAAAVLLARITEDRHTAVAVPLRGRLASVDIADRALSHWKTTTGAVVVQRRAPRSSPRDRAVMKRIHVLYALDVATRTAWLTEVYAFQVAPRARRSGQDLHELKGAMTRSHL